MPYPKPTLLSRLRSSIRSRFLRTSLCPKLMLSSCEVVSDLLQIYVSSLYVHIYAEEIAVPIYLNSEKSICLWFVVCAFCNGHHRYRSGNAFSLRIVAVPLEYEYPSCVQFFDALMFGLLSCCSDLNLYHLVKELAWTKSCSLLEIQNDRLTNCLMWMTRLDGLFNLYCKSTMH